MDDLRGQDVIDSRDVIERIEELEGMLPENVHEVLPGDMEELSAIQEELEALKSLEAEAECSPDWNYGETLILDTYFTEYIEELIDDCYEMPKEINSGQWPYRHMHINYDAAADDAMQDYMEVNFDGSTYYIRA